MTRGGLKLLDQYGFGAAVATKSARITRDLDVLKRDTVTFSGAV